MSARLATLCLFAELQPGESKPWPRLKAWIEANNWRLLGADHEISQTMLTATIDADEKDDDDDEMTSYANMYSN